MKYPDVMTEDQTIAAAAAGVSLSRFGDGELRLAAGGACTSQRAEVGLAEELRTILAKPGRRLLPCIPNIKPSPRAEWWEEYAKPKYRMLMRLEQYGSAFVTRPDNIPTIDRPDYWDKVRSLWSGKDVILVVGDEKSLTPGRMASAKSIAIVKGPRQHAYTELKDIEKQVLQHVNGANKRDVPVMMCLGAAATVLAKRLSDKGVWALDLGHVGMFMKHAGAYRYTMNQLISKTALDAIRRHKPMGGYGKNFLTEIASYRDQIGARAVLDYGCGRGELRQAAGDAFRVYEYDPGVPERASPPKPVDLVVCADVLEHVDVNTIDTILEHIYLIAAKGAFIVTNVSYYSGEWWLDKLTKPKWSNFTYHFDDRYVRFKAVK